MAGITAAQVKDLRERTGLPMMDCKKALSECDGDQQRAIQWLRERGAQVLSKRMDRETSFGRFGIYASFDPPVGAMVELKCESAPVTQNEEFVQLANDLAQQLATGPGAATGDELLAQPSPSKPGMTLGEQKDELFNRIREVFNVGRFERIEGACGSYSHNAATVAGVLLQVEGGTPELAKDVCMHIAAMRPTALTSMTWMRRRSSGSERFSAKPPCRRASRRVSWTRWSTDDCGTSTPNASCWSSSTSKAKAKIPWASSPKATA
jgi:elongation factor Ts